MSYPRFSFLFLLLACTGTGDPTHPEPAGPPRKSAPVDATDLSEWRPERIALPPGFAPDLPPGEELLLFAPGMFEAGSEELWSYVFLIRLEGAGLGAADLERFLELYYDGLIEAVGGSNGMDVGPDPAQVSLRSTGSSTYVAEIHLIDAFVTGEPIDLRVHVQVGGERGEELRVQASPQPPEHPIWGALAQAAASLEL